MGEKNKIAVRTCGGCCCEFNRRGVFSKLSTTFADTCEFKYSYKLEEDENFLLAVLISGCDSHCAPASETITNVIIDHKNWDHCDQVLQEALSLELK